MSNPAMPNSTDLVFTRTSPYGTESEPTYSGALSFLLPHCAKVGVTGFCMGGALTIAAAVHLPGLSAASCFYGIPPAELADPALIKIPFQGHFAEQDDWCTPALADALQAKLPASAEIHRYAAQHGFFNERLGSAEKLSIFAFNVLKRTR